MRSNRFDFKIALYLAAALLPFGAHAFDITLTTDAVSPQATGVRVQLQAEVTGADPATLLYRFEERGATTGTFRMLQDFRYKPTFDWSTLRSDPYVLRVTALDPLTGETKVAGLPYSRFSPGAVLGTPTIRETDNPLVVQFSAPPCPGGGLLRVRFKLAGSAGAGQTTHYKSCRPNKGVDHYVAGMRPDSDYEITGEVLINGQTFSGNTFTIRTGIPFSYEPDYQVVAGPTPGTSTEDGVHMLSYTAGIDDGNFMIATDLDGVLIWAYGQVAAGEVSNVRLYRPVAGGTFMVAMTEADEETEDEFLREIDLAGNVVRETNIYAVNRQLIAMGEDTITSFHHEARKIPGGFTVGLASVERVLIDEQGPGPVNVYGEMVLAMNENFRVLWVWNSFEKLDTTDVAILDEECVNGQGGCPPLFLGEPAKDWLHMNAIAYSPADGNLVLSARHQDAVYKIDFANGTGSGDVVWELGEHGDFSLVADPAEEWPWFTHQHDAQYQAGGVFVVYDNGVTRFEALGDQEVSRGQVYQLDEVNMVATLLHNFEFTHYSLAVGSAQRLRNGNYHFDSGFLGDFSNPSFLSMEVDSNTGQSAWALGGLNRVYRAFRLKTLYAP